jgi:hypothetical protein
MAMRQELIERAVHELSLGGWHDSDLLCREMTLQELIYAHGVISDHRDDMFDERVCKQGAAASLGRRGYTLHKLRR